MCLLVVMLSSTTKTSKTGDMPMPQPAARSSRPAGMALTLVIPALSTQHSATMRDLGVGEPERDLAAEVRAPGPLARVEHDGS